MKTLKITELKKELLVVELPENGYWGTDLETLEIRDFLTKDIFTATGFSILGKPNEIKEEDVVDLVERTGLGNPSYSGEWYECYNNPDAMYSKATVSFNSLLEKHLFWVNPVSLERANIYKQMGNKFSYKGVMKCWQEAQEKTFDRNRTLIFVKN